MVEWIAAGLADAPAVATAPPAWQWIAENFQVIDAETGKARPFIVWPWMVRVLLDTLPEGEDLPYSLLLYSTIKKAGKTAFNAAICAELMFNRAPDGAELYNFANAKEQASGRVYRAVKYAIEHNPALLARCSSAPLETITRLRGGTTLQAMAAMHANIAGANPFYSGWCVDDQTEALTRAGWKPVAHLTIGDEVATLNPATGCMEWHRPRAVNVTPYKGQMVRFQHRRADFLVTPNHRVLGRFVTHSRYKQQAVQRGWWFEEAQNAANFSHGWLKADAAWEGQPGYDPTDAALMGYYISEGHCAKDGAVIISQSQAVHPEIYDDIGRTLTALGLRFTRSPSRYRIKDAALHARLSSLGKAADKYIPDDLKNADVPALAAFFTAYMDGDGWRATAKSSGWQCCTVSQRLADDLMEVGLKLGYQPRLMSITPPKGNNQAMYRLSFSRGPVAWSRGYEGKKTGAWSYEDYDGLVACPSVPHGIFYIRRNGKCCWTGNTELWGYEHEKELRAWAEMTPPPTIRNSLRVVDTYAGYEGESGLLNQLEDQLKASPRLHVDGFELPAEYRAYAHQVAAQQPELAEYLLPADDAGSGPVQFDYGLPIYADVESRLYGFWDEGEQARRVPWQRGVRGLGYYAAEARSLLPQQYRRLHLNMRAKRGGQFVGIEVWNALPRVTAWSAGDIDAVVLAVDAATKDDHMALVGVRVRDRRAEECFVKEWLPEADERAGGALVLDPRAVRTEVLRLRDEGMRILAIGFDPYQFHATYLELAADGFNMVEITQGQPRLESDTLLWTLIRDGRIAHTGHGALRVAVENANALAETGKTGDERRLRIVKGSGKVDPLVALSMATWVALNPPKERDASVGVAPGSGLLAGAGSSSGTRERTSGARLPSRQGGAAQRFKRVQR